MTGTVIEVESSRRWGQRTNREGDYGRGWVWMVLSKNMTWSDIFSQNHWLFLRMDNGRQEWKQGDQLKGLCNNSDEGDDSGFSHSGSSGNIRKWLNSMEKATWSDLIKI